MNDIKTRERWQWRGTPYFLKFQDSRNFTTKLFTAMFMTLAASVSYPSAEKQLMYSTSLSTGP